MGEVQYSKITYENEKLTYFALKGQEQKKLKKWVEKRNIFSVDNDKHVLKCFVVLE